MDLYMVLKVCKQYCRVVVLNLTAKYNGRLCKNICVVGNLPELYTQMTIYLDIVNNETVTDYRVALTDKNISALKKNNVDIEEYKKALSVHNELKKENYDWSIYKYESDQLYKRLPFKKADHLHKAIVDNAVDEARIDAINTNIIQKARSLHLAEYDLGEYINYFEVIEKEGSYEELPIISKVKCLSKSCFGFHDGKIYDYEISSKQEAIIKNINDRKSNEYPLLKRYEIKSFINSLEDSHFEQEQLNVLDCLVGSSPCIITGKAGTGKTSVIKLIIDCYSKFYGLEDILLIAPTGKASRRLAEKTGMPSCTIHKALRKKPDDDFVFYNAGNPLPYKLVIVDESSMIDTLLMYDLLNAIAPSSKVIFAGDHNQLSPVGYGEPFFDFLKMIPVNYLTINHRQSSDTEILKVANGILDGDGIKCAKGVSVSYLDRKQINKVLDYLSSHLDDNSYQIISPYNYLNNEINAYLKKGKYAFNVGDKVIMTRNTSKYCNGDIGRITSIKTNQEDGGILNFRTQFRMQISIDNRIVEITENEYDDISLAYAITVHKMQGSESERVIVITPNSEKCLSNTRLMYTAATRARKELNFVLF